MTNAIEPDRPNFGDRSSGDRSSGVADEARLPERVRAAIRAQEDRSEILIGWIQLAIVATFGTLYAVSPKTFAEGGAFEPVPWVLGAYLLFTLIRLAAARRVRLPGWLLVLSVLIDMALLMGLIWSFHLQYEQPPSFVLKAPALLYVFIFIALRALRFEARYVVLAGIVAAAGWAFVVGWVITANPGDTMITRDYVEYLTSNSILLGAEFDKIASILTVTTVLAFAIHRARRLMVRAIVEQTAARELSRFFAPEVAHHISSAEGAIRAGEGEARDAAILYTDMRGFTALARRMPAAEALALLAEYQARLVPVIQDHGGSVDKFLGDGILATFGAALPTDSYAADALRTVDALVGEIAAWREGRLAAGLAAPPVGLAVATGRVLFGAVGDESRLEYTVIGDPVNLAAKLEKHTKAEKVSALASREAVETALRQGYVPPVERLALAGRRIEGLVEPVDLIVLNE
ncbi:MAG: adenylate/guanylate cyclase domain-containing protein [Rhodospirillaceae bacterium]|nr:adenylate/guanylate cyclase domain-containing protein [Rhodospirillaceae bacterium]